MPSQSVNQSFAGAFDQTNRERLVNKGAQQLVKSE